MSATPDVIDDDPEVDDAASRRAALGVLLAIIGIGAVVLFHVGRHQWFFLDEFEFLADRELDRPGDLFRDHNGHWSTTGVIAYRLVFGAVGLRHYWPYQALSIGAHLATAVALCAVMRRSRVDPWLATTAVVPFVFLGTASENIFWAFQHMWSVGLLCGLLAVIAFDHHGPVGRRDAGGVALGLVAVMSSPVGLGMLVATTLVALVRRGGRVAAANAVGIGGAYLIWRVAVDPETDPSAGWAPTTRLARAILGESATAYGGRALGALAIVAVAAVGLGLLLARPDRRRTLDGIALPLALAIGGVTFAVLTAYGRALLSSEPAYRYLHATIVFVLPLVAVGVNELVRRWPRVLPVAMVLLLVGLPDNVAALDSRSPFVLGNERSAFALATVAEEEDVDPDVRPQPLWIPGLRGEWLAHASRSGWFADQEPLTDQERRTASLLLAVEVVEPESVGPCDGDLTAPLTLEPGDRVRFGRGSVRVVETVDGLSVAQADLIALPAEGTVIAIDTFVEVHRPIVLTEDPFAPWHDAALCE